MISKFQENRPIVERWKILEIYEYEVPLGTNIYEIYDSKDSTH